MEILIRNASFETPSIEMNPESGRIEMTGRSLPEDSATFYKPVLSWIDDYLRQPVPRTEIEIKLEYFNTATSMVLLKMFNKLQNLNEVTVHWYHYPEDDDMLESGKEFEELCNLNFVFHELS